MNISYSTMVFQGTLRNKGKGITWTVRPQVWLEVSPAQKIKQKLRALKVGCSWKRIVSSKSPFYNQLNNTYLTCVHVYSIACILIPSMHVLEARYTNTHITSYYSTEGMQSTHLRVTHNVPFIVQTTKGMSWISSHYFEWCSLLDGGFNPTEKYEFVNWEDDISNIYK